MHTIIIGKGAAGKCLYGEVLKNKNLNFIGFVDDYKKDVLGKIVDLSLIIEQYKIQLAYIAMPSVEKNIINDIRESLKGYNIKLKILPSYADIIQYGNVTLNKTKPIDIEDILGRPLVKQDFVFIKSNIKGKTIFISGAAGSIGSELAYQVALSEPAKLICFDKAETPIFNLQDKLKEFSDVIYIIGDILNEKKLENIFSSQKIDIVLHAAAYKHVPLMEANPDEAIRNNIYGSEIVLKIACKNKVDNLVIVSTDKAVNPTNIMGATKRAVEKLMEVYSNSYPDTKISAVRFGNVLRSNGSVVNIFEDRIKKHESLFVTHHEVIRYFMTVQEAAQLILISAFQGQSNEIFVLDMGKPVKIIKLAEDMISLNGLIPYVDIDIKIVGLRPGEKLFEELLINAGQIKKTPNKKIFITNKEELFDPVEFYNNICEFRNEFPTKSNQEIREWLQKIVPSYKPTNYLMESASKSKSFIETSKQAVF